MVDRTAGQRRQRRARAGDRGVAGVVGIAHDRVGAGDVEIVTDQGHAERRMEMVEKDGSRRRLSPLDRSAGA